VFMTKRLLFVVFSVLLSVLLSPKVFGQSCRMNIGSDGDPEVWFEGMVDDSPVRVYWSMEPDGKLTGGLYDLKNWSPVLLDGARGSNCNFRIKERAGTTSDASRPAVFWEGTLRNGVFEGTRSSSRMQQPATVRLQRIPPMDCNGKGKWIRFTDSRFPISFEYPEIWRIVQTPENNIRLMCPDPRAIQFEGAGVTIDLLDGANELTQTGRFTKSHGTWLVLGSDIAGSCDSPGALCTDATVLRQDGMTVVHGSGPVRVFRSGHTYEGVGEEEAYILLLKDRSMYVSSVLVKETTTMRIVRSAKPIPPEKK
jgi:hypothetical protein